MYTFLENLNKHPWEITPCHHKYLHKFIGVCIWHNFSCNRDLKAHLCFLQDENNSLCKDLSNERIFYKRELDSFDVQLESQKKRLAKHYTALIKALKSDRENIDPSIAKHFIERFLGELRKNKKSVDDDDASWLWAKIAFPRYAADLVLKFGPVIGCSIMTMAFALTSAAYSFTTIWFRRWLGWSPCDGGRVIPGWLYCGDPFGGVCNGSINLLYFVGGPLTDG